jgi:[ribosomal protein S5]-alanine N-acetyltransferase
VRSSVPRLRLEDGPTAVRPFARGDIDALFDARLRNRSFLEPYEPVREEGFFTRAAQAREITLDMEAWAHGSGYAFAVLDTEQDDALIGRVALSNVVRGPWLNATLGYWVDEHANSRGHCTRAVRLVCRFAFEHARLHRVQPAIMPRNARSRRVVEKAGFRHEGRALRYLKIDDHWEDHDLFAMTREDYDELVRQDR